MTQIKNRNRRLSPAKLLIKYRKLLVVSAACLLFLTGMLFYFVNTSNQILRQNCSHGIVELQLALKGTKTIRIFDEWQSCTIPSKQKAESTATGQNGLDQAKAQQNLDWWLIAGYTATFCVFILLSCSFLGCSALSHQCVSLCPLSFQF